ncbi:MAG: hypothetical protein ACREBS_08120 [Nitrososphaerales archaeon]
MTAEILDLILEYLVSDGAHTAHEVSIALDFPETDVIKAFHLLLEIGLVRYQGGTAEVDSVLREIMNEERE